MRIPFNPSRALGLVAWFFLGLFGAAASAQTTLPTLTSVTRTSATSPTAGNALSYTVNYTAGSYPVTFIEVTVADATGTTHGVYGTSGTNFSLLTNAMWLNGAYTVERVSFSDSSGRITIYYRDGHVLASPPLAGAPTTHSVNLSAQDFQLSGGAASASLPMLTGLTRTSAAALSAGGTLAYTVNYTAGSYPVTFIEVTVADAAGTTHSFYGTSGTAFSTATNSSWLNGAYTVERVSFSDGSGRITIYYRDGHVLASPPLTGAPTTHSINLSAQDFQLSGGAASASLPMLTGLTRTSAAALSAGGTLAYTVNYTAGSYPVTFIEVTVADAAGTTHSFYGTSGTAFSTATSSSWPNGAYTVDRVSFSDSSGRITIYYPDGHVLASPPLAGAPTTHSINFSAQGFQLGAPGIAPGITTQPANQTQARGGTADFSVTASGTAPLSYQWFKNGMAIAGATNAALAVTNVQSTDAGTYTVTVSNAFGSVTSNGAALSLSSFNFPPSFVSQPGNATATDGGGFTVSVQVTTSNFSEVTWQAKVGSRTINALGSSVVQNNNAITASVVFGPVSVVDSGTFQVVATNAYGSTLSAARTLAVSAAAPAITTQPVGQAVALGSNATFTVVASGTAPLSYQWRKNGTAIAGATSSTLTLSNVQSGDAADYTVTVGNSVGSVTSSGATLSVNLPVAPSITVPPADVTANAGASVGFSATAAGTGPLSYQWYKNSTAIAGATSASLTLPNVAAADAASYSVLVTNAAGSVQSPAARLTVVVPDPARLVNLSTLTALPAGEDFVLGFVVRGADPSAAKPLLVRVAGPSLAAYGVTDWHGDPKLEFYSGPTKTGENDNWGGDAALRSTFDQVGAFPFLEAASKDAALHVASVPSGSSTVRVSGVGSAGGAVLAELYETTPGSQVTTATPRLVNASVRKKIGDGLTVGFVIRGTGAKTLVIRAVGPTLVQYGVRDVVADPIMTVFDATQAPILINDNWQAKDAAPMAAVGAFALPPGSKDAAMVATFDPGLYTVQVRGAGSTTGEVLVEIYDVP